MGDLALVACTKTKRQVATHASDLYVSPLFRKSLLAALDRCKQVRILSAKHGLLNPGDIVSPYEQTLKFMPAAERAAWGTRVAAQLASAASPNDTLIFFTGDDYFKPLKSTLLASGYRLQQPLGRRSLGARLQYLREINDEALLKTMLIRFGQLMRQLARIQVGGRLLSQATGRQPWPERGLYFVVEPVGPAGRDWITRVGTHAVSAGSRTTLWDRISTHRGVAGHGGGSHRSSIFRSHVGRALGRRGDEALPASWGVGQSAPADVRASESLLERKVSSVIGDMRLLWLSVPDAAGPRSDRAYLERNIIGLLSRTNVLGIRPAPNSNWLGRASVDWRIVTSGLWNLDHLFFRPDPRFLDVLEIYINIMGGKDAPREESLAPVDWACRPSHANHEQLNLFETDNKLHGA
ncbi:DUF6884 domain-containing protein [Bradyrhizobium frederickii]|uniref:DUF6884 domain-containing protein n=1 Tax=Bradyrhizobium frederickii TaxID=2560054 RepID=UPI003D3195EE